ncbi:MAG: hypothetical protein ACREIV_00485 [Planctomycetaceae bacterium]
MRRSVLVGGLAAAALLVGTAEAGAVPSFTRQTGMTCNQCHVSFGGPVPNFTSTGKRFKLNGYRMPMVAEKIEAGEPGTASGRRLNIPLIPYLSFRYQSVFASQSKAPGADEAGPITSNPTNRLSFFPGGALGDNFGLWIELYLTPDGSPDRNWTLGLFSFDEFDLRFVKITERNTFGLSFSNQSIKELAGFGPWPTVLSNMTRGGFAGWSHPNRGNMYAYGYLNNKVIAAVGASPGEDNLDWDRLNYQAQLAYAPLNSDNAELWFNVATQFGNDGIPIITTTRPTPDRTWAYGDVAEGISQLRSSDPAQQVAYTSSDIGDYFRIEPEVRYGFVDKGPHSLESMVRYVIARETYSDNAEAKQDALAGGIRYMFDRTIGGDVLLTKYTRFDFIDPAGSTHEIDTGTVSLNTYLKYQPAMNFILMLQVGNSNRNTLLPDQPTVSAGWSWSLGADILF